MIETVGQGHDIKPGSDRSFGLVFTAFFALLGLYGIFSGHAGAWGWLVAAAGIGLVAFAAPAWLAPFNQLWFRFGMLLARIVQPLVIGALFFLVVTPIGLLMRLAGKDPLRLRHDPDARTYWIVRDPPGPPPETMSRQF